MKKNIPFHYIDLALKFLEGSSSEPEEKELDEWIRRDHRNLELFEELRLNWRSRPQHTSRSVQAFDAVSRRLGLSETQDRPLPPEAAPAEETFTEGTPVVREAAGESPLTLKRFVHGRLVRRAASFAGFLLLALGAWYFLSKDTAVTYRTDYAQVSTFRLPDSSLVTLNANSTLTLPENWLEQPDRKVILEGEAFFEVTKKLQDSSVKKAFKKFIVSTGNLEVEVLGTTFNVNTRDSETSVALNSGSVRLKLHEDDREILMQPGDFVEIAPSAEPVIKKGVEVTNYSTWKNGQLYFDGSTMQEIKVLLRHNYNLVIEFEAPEAIKDVRLRGTFPSDKLELLLNAISDVTGTVQTEENGRIYYKQKAKLK